MLSDKELREHLATLEFTDEEISNTTFDKATIKKQYNRLALRIHPDKHQNATNEEKEKFNEKFNAVTKAKDALENEFEEKSHLKTIDPAIAENITKYNEKVIKILEDRRQELAKKVAPKAGVLPQFNSLNSQGVRLAAVELLLNEAEKYKQSDRPINIDEIISKNVHGAEKEVGLNPTTSGIFRPLGFQSRTENMLNEIRALHDQYFPPESKSPTLSRK